MHEPSICICVQEDIVQPLKWMLEEFKDSFRITTFRSIVKFDSACGTDTWDLLILDSTLTSESVKTYLEEMKNKKPGLKTILIVPPVEDKEQIIEIIQEKLVQGLVIKPFSAEVLSKYLDKCCPRR